MERNAIFGILAFLGIMVLSLTRCQKANKEGITRYEIPQSGEQSLHVVFKDQFLVGSAINDAIVAGSDSVSRDIVKKEFNAITAENCMKAESVSPRRGVYDFTAADAFVNFGEQNDMFILGHTLVWHNQTPEWFFNDAQGNPNTPDQQKEQMRMHIQAVAGRYSGKVHAWDVVNEVIDNDGSYRPTIWVKRMGDGDDMVKLAFQYASEYAPNAELYYNDFNAWRPEKRDGIVRMVRMLKEAGIRIDGVGIQAHWGLNFPKIEYIQQAIEAYAELGVKVMITELDIDVLPLTKEGQVVGKSLMESQYQLEEFENFFDPYKDGIPKEVDIKLAKRYRELFELFAKNSDKIDRVTFWGVHDGMSWKNDYPIPNRTNYPLLYTRDWQAKMAKSYILKTTEVD